MDMDAVTGDFERLFPSFSFDAQGVLADIMSGQLLEALKKLGDGLSGAVVFQREEFRTLFFTILVLGVAAALFTNFADMFKDATSMIRDRIAVAPEEFAAVINAPEFHSRFTVCGSTLKNVPRGYDSGHQMAEYLKMKSWYVEYPVSDESLLDAESFVTESARTFRAMKPFNDFLNSALEEFKMPER